MAYRHSIVEPGDHGPGLHSVPALPRGLTEMRRLRADAAPVTLADGSLALRLGPFEAAVADTPARRTVFDALTAHWRSADEVERIVGDAHGLDALASARLLLARLAGQGWLARRHASGSRTLLVVEPQRLGARPARPVADERKTYEWTGDTALVVRDGRLQLENPFAASAVLLEDATLAGALAATATGASAAGLARAADLDEPVAAEILAVLHAEGHLAPAGTSPGARAYWTPAELAVHDRSRAGRHTKPIGGTYRFRGVTEPEPALRPAPDDWPLVDLPDPEPLAATGMSLADAVASRRTLRHHDDDRPIGVAQLSSFLHSVQRMRDVSVAGGMETAGRPYPNAGRIGELEVYPLVRRCDGLAPALYWYDSLHHRLRRVGDDAPATRRLLDYARAAAAAPRPQVLLLITARMPRLAWKYEGLCYPTALRDAGVLIELMYLVATAMGLAPCALGTGDSAAFERLAGIDPLVEPVVADLALGSIGASR